MQLKVFKLSVLFFYLGIVGFEYKLRSFVSISLVSFSLENNEKVCKEGMTASDHCTGEFLKQNGVSKTIAFSFNSRAAVKTLGSSQVSLKLVGSCLSATKVMSTQNEITLA